MQTPASTLCIGLRRWYQRHPLSLHCSSVKYWVVAKISVNWLVISCTINDTTAYLLLVVDQLVLVTRLI